MSTKKYICSMYVQIGEVIGWVCCYVKGSRQESAHTLFPSCSLSLSRSLSVRLISPRPSTETLALHDKCRNNPDVRRGCSQSEFQVTNFFSCSEECGEVLGDKF